MEKLSNIAAVTTGHTFRTAIEHSDFGFPVIQAKDLTSDIVHEDSLPLVNINPPASSQVFDGDMLLSSRGNFRAARYEAEDDQIAIAASSLFVIRSKNKDISSEFIVLYLNSPSAQRYIRGHSTGSSIKTISINDLKRLKMPILSSAKQDHLVKLYKNIQLQNELTQKRAKLANDIYQSALNRTIKGAA